MPEKNFAASVRTAPSTERTREHEAPSVSKESLELELDQAEINRRNKITETQKRVTALDREFILHIQHSEGRLADTVEYIETIETLAFGTEKKEGDATHVVGEDGVNAISKRTFEGTPPRTAYVKPQSGETFVRFDPKTNTAVEVHRSLDETRMLVEDVVPFKKDVAEKVTPVMKRYFEHGKKRRQDVATCYGIPLEAVPLNDTEIPAKFGIPPGGQAVREYAASRISDLFHLNAVPHTVLRAEEDGADICSVQEAVQTDEPGKTVRPMERSDYNELVDKGENHPAAESLMRIACLDYLLQSNDRHPENILLDTATNTFHGIDNGLALGLSKRETEKQTDGTTKDADKPMDLVISVPMEIVSKRADWKLDEEARQEMKRVYEAMVGYLQNRGDKKETDIKTLEGLSEGAEMKFVSSLFRLVYENEAIAKKEGLQFMQRLGELTRNGRPPNLIENKRQRANADMYFTEQEKKRAKK